MFWRKTSNIDADDEAWLIACWSWLDGHFGPITRDGHPGLVLPVKGTFPDLPPPGKGRAKSILAYLQRFFGISDWPIELVAQAAAPELPKSVVFGETRSRGALGTYVQAGNAVRITYDPGLLPRPLELAATLAHEVAHARLSTIAEAPPGGWDMAEFATDLTVAHFGLGLFSANAAREFRAYTDYDRQGWESRTAGYLSENEWTFALAIFARRRQIDFQTLRPYLKDYLFAGLKRNSRYLDANPDLVPTG